MSDTAWVVTRARRTQPGDGATYNVDSRDGQSLWTVSVWDDEPKPKCWAHGTACEHALAVAAMLARPR